VKRLRGKSWTGWLGGAVWRLAVLLLVLYGAAQVGSRTEWFRRRVERRISDLTGLDVRVGRIRATEALNLKIRDVVSLTDRGGIELRLVRVRWRFFRPRGAPLIESVRVDGWSATFAPDARGEWRPAVLGRPLEQALGLAGIRLPEPEALAEAGTPPAGGEPAGQAGGDRSAEELPRVEMRWGTVRIEDAAGGRLATVSDLDLLLTSMRTPADGRVSHLDVRAGELKVAGGPRVAGLHVAMVEAEDRRFLAALEADDWGAAAPPPDPSAEYRALLDAMDEPVPPPVTQPAAAGR